MALREKKLKSRTFEFRVAEEERDLIHAAAKIRNTSPSNFVREHAISAAEAVIHEQTRFVLTEEQWNRLDQIFTEPPRVLPQLSKLFLLIVASKNL